ncbi:uncharacterized protein I303_102854 [Kwoniella dejecticola CBS 10117]|uniref:Uncharacterized protein n=1 Tax=Kwoniella dejecticola CBS 10117 TaxID=1296121 RepID=A0A1A6A9X0_9TREE|nr:uncharacterized protein I303_02870 [Kwoniella dejecticola CBS 10117]OBR86851.1 hypothetical protein I303_02870 [Kwoniella dejecticola CBS 10117]
MRVKETNGFSVWLGVGEENEKLVEQRIRKMRNPDGSFRMECYVCPKPDESFTINVHLGRQKPYTGDWIAEPVIDGQAINSLHVRKRWHVTHKMSTYFQKEEDEDGSLECDLSFGDIVNPEGEIFEAGDTTLDEGRGTILVKMSRGEIEKEKAAKHNLRQQVTNSSTGHTRTFTSTKKNSRKAGKKAVFDEKWYYIEEDEKTPLITFVFKVRTQQYLMDHDLVSRVPAQQHPSQVSRTTRLKVEPDLDFEPYGPSTSASTNGVVTQSRKRVCKVEESSDDQDVHETESAKRLRVAEERIKSLEVKFAQSSSGTRS